MVRRYISWHSTNLLSDAITLRAKTVSLLFDFFLNIELNYVSRGLRKAIAAACIMASTTVIP